MTEIYSCTLLEATNLKSKFRQIHVPSERSRGDPPLSLQAPGGSWHSLVCASIISIFCFVFTQPPSLCLCVFSLFLLSMPVIGFKISPQFIMISSQDLLLITSAKTFPDKVIF